MASMQNNDTQSFTNATRWDVLTWCTASPTCFGPLDYRNDDTYHCGIGRMNEVSVSLKFHTLILHHFLEHFEFTLYVDFWQVRYIPTIGWFFL